MKLRRSAEAEIELMTLLDGLASILITLDITPSRLAQLARASFVKAGAKTAKMRSSGRPHIARVAAITGLSRAEVKRIVDANFSAAQLEPEQAPRALRVAEAWRLSKPYSSRGRPRELRLSGATPSFESLCKQYSGDIPHMVILRDLERRKLVRFSRSREAVSLRRGDDVTTGSKSQLEALAFASAFFASMSGSDRVLVRRQETIYGSTNIPAGYVQQAISERVNSTLDGFPSLFMHKRNRSGKHKSVEVFALVTKAEAKDE
jgi:hypothetical protein